uniref:restriction endonuclease subunit S n=1 Tax=Candidatus Limisoma sp. TaxID=3076476 RepID=UPI003FEF4548
MKHNWEYKRLGDICDLYQPKTIAASELVEDGEYDVYGANGIIGKFTRYNHEFPEILLTCRGATCGTINISNPKSWINGNAMVIHSKSSELLFAYLKYAMTALDYSNIITGAAQPQITRQSLTPTNIPLPPMEVQERIVAELDKINETIGDCRELLRNLDALKLSLFYDYFGDPIANPKCWKTKPIKSIAPSGESFLEPQELDGKFWLLNLEQVESNSGRILEIEYFPIENIGSSTVNFDEGNVLYSKLRPYLNKVVIPYGRGYCTSELIPLRPNQDYVSREYIAYALRLPEFVKFISAKTGGAKMPRVKMQHFWNFQMPVPPLELQEKFAERIEQIEAQKKAVEQTIAELQTLLDSRMDYWFN